MVENGSITPLTPIQQLDELKKLIELINVKTYLTCDHVSNLLVLKDWKNWFNKVIFNGVEGVLPYKKNKILEEIDKAKKGIRVENKGAKILNCNDLVKVDIII